MILLFQCVMESIVCLYPGMGKRMSVLLVLCVCVFCSVLVPFSCLLKGKGR